MGVIKVSLTSSDKIRKCIITCLTCKRDLRKASVKIIFHLSNLTCVGALYPPVHITWKTCRTGQRS